ncbi:cytochrome c oxidase assembly factor Coa1 family protein [Synechococcus sp. RSCCF101]|uniref:cytochrome c oxidase assembly factor Coa1 family protein n=1 Tax=Synechococcus sp. RSCCF101 TaxID=2511069 RepID=UPI00177E573F|nr:cytochrome c oxidase assembly factor Coa1 family protein [Synechococcus sp. RSCCF101]
MGTLRTVLVLVAGLILAGVALTGGILLLVVHLVQTSGPSRQALEALRENPQAVRQLGEPVRRGWWFTGQVRRNGDAGMARLTLPVEGSRASGRLRIDARREKGSWCFLQLELRAGAGAELDLLPAEAAPACREGLPGSGGPVI